MATHRNIENGSVLYKIHVSNDACSTITQRIIEMFEHEVVVEGPDDIDHLDSFDSINDRIVDTLDYLLETAMSEGPQQMREDILNYKVHCNENCNPQGEQFPFIIDCKYRHRHSLQPTMIRITVQPNLKHTTEEIDPFMAWRL